MRFEGTCESCRKRSYGTRRMARAAAKQIRGDHMTAYPCPAAAALGASLWHLGHLPADVRAGRADKGAYQARAVARRRAAS